MAKKQTMKQLRKELKKESKDLKKFKKSRLKGIAKAEAKLGWMEREQSKRIAKLDPKVMKKYQDVLKASKAPVAKKMAKKVAKKTVGKALGKLIPGVGAAIIAHDVLKGVSKATCSKRGGKWASGKCVGAKKTKFKPGSKVKDPISKR